MMLVDCGMATKQCSGPAYILLFQKRLVGVASKLLGLLIQSGNHFTHVSKVQLKSLLLNHFPIASTPLRARTGSSIANANNALAERPKRLYDSATALRCFGSGSPGLNFKFSWTGAFLNTFKSKTC